LKVSIEPIKLIRDSPVVCSFFLQTST